jgi:hypothetical protein
VCDIWRVVLIGAELPHGERRRSCAYTELHQRLAHRDALIRARTQFQNQLHALLQQPLVGRQAPLFLLPATTLGAIGAFVCEAGSSARSKARKPARSTFVARRENRLVPGSQQAHSELAARNTARPAGAFGRGWPGRQAFTPVQREGRGTRSVSQCWKLAPRGALLPRPRPAGDDPSEAQCDQHYHRELHSQQYMGWVRTRGPRTGRRRTRTQAGQGLRDRARSSTAQG